MFRLGDVTFLGGHTDDAAKLRERLGLRRGIVADSELTDRITSELTAMARYHDVRARELPAGRAGKFDIEVELTQAEFAPPLDRAVPEIRPTIEQAVNWFARPETWTEDLVFSIRPVAKADAEGDSPVSRFAGEVQILLGRDGIVFVVRRVFGGDGPPDLVLLLRDGELVVSAPTIGWSSRTLIDTEMVVDFVLEPGGPDDGAWKMKFGVGVQSDGEAGIRFGRLLSPLGITALVERNLRWERRGEKVDLRFVDDALGIDIALGSVEKETGVVHFAAEFETEGADGVLVTLRSEPGRFETLSRQVAAATADRPNSGNDLSTLLPRALSKDVTPLLTELFNGDEPSLFALRCVVSSLLRDGGVLSRSISAVERLLKEDGDETGAASSEDPFGIPVDSQAAAIWLRNPFAFFGQVAVTYLAPLLPVDSWPRTLLVEGICLTLDQSSFTDREVVRLLNSPEVGPIGYWALSEASSRVGQNDIARRFAERWLAVATVDGFRRELTLLEQIAPGLIASVGKVVKEATSADVDRALRSLGTDAVDPVLHDFASSSRRDKKVSRNVSAQRSSSISGAIDSRGGSTLDCDHAGRISFPCLRRRSERLRRSSWRRTRPSSVPTTSRGERSSRRWARSSGPSSSFVLASRFVATTACTRTSAGCCCSSAAGSRPSRSFTRPSSCRRAAPGREDSFGT